jgi:hypothetical protein
VVDQASLTADRPLEAVDKRVPEWTTESGTPVRPMVAVRLEVVAEVLGEATKPCRSAEVAVGTVARVVAAPEDQKARTVAMSWSAVDLASLDAEGGIGEEGEMHRVADHSYAVAVVADVAAKVRPTGNDTSIVVVGLVVADVVVVVAVDVVVGVVEAQSVWAALIVTSAGTIAVLDSESQKTKF